MPLPFLTISSVMNMLMRKIRLELKCFDFIIVSFNSIAKIRQNWNSSQSVQIGTTDWKFLTRGKYWVLRGGREYWKGIIKRPEIKSSIGVRWDVPQGPGHGLRASAVCSTCFCLCSPSLLLPYSPNQLCTCLMHEWNPPCISWN